MRRLSYFAEYLECRVLYNRVMPFEEIQGALVAGKFRVGRLLGKGGMGRIYEAIQEPLGRSVALKVLRNNEQLDALDVLEFQKRFALEAASCARLQHPNIVVVHDFGALDERFGHGCYLAMELVDGETLQACIQRGPMAWERALRVTLEIARALAAAHRQGMIHRDLKPANVMLSVTPEGERVKVLDFGLVKLLADDSEKITMDDVFLGSPRYMSPEQIQQQTLDGRSDLYSLGVCLHQMLAGKTPFERETAAQTLVAHLHDSVPPLARQDAPGAVQSVVLRLLEKDPSHRYANADEFVEHLQVVIQHPELLHSEVTSPVRGDPKTVRDRKRPRSLREEPPQEPAQSWKTSRALIAAILVGIGAVAALQIGRRPHEAATDVGAGVEVAAEPRPVVDADASAPSCMVESTPIGATVSLAGVLIGVTPLRFDASAWLHDTNEHVLLLELAGHVPAQVVVRRGMACPSTVFLSAAPAARRVNPIPAHIKTRR